MTAVADRLCELQKRIKELERAISLWHKNNEASRRLATIPGVGTITASAIVPTVRFGRKSLVALVFEVHDQFVDAFNPQGSNNAELADTPADKVGQHGFLFDKNFAGTVKGQHRLLLNYFDRCKAHRRAADGFTNGFRIKAIAFPRRTYGLTSRAGIIRTS
jgi:hypothetical protein